MTVRAWAGVMLLTVSLAGVGQGSAQDGDRRALARDLAHLMLDDTLRRGLDEQVRAGMMQAVAVALQERLNRRLQEVEWRLLGEIVQRFVGDTLPPDRTEELAAEVYAGQFEEAELRDLLGFQRSAVGRKAARLAPVIAAETARAVENEIRRSPAMPRMLDELQRAFPVLRRPESP